MLIILIVVTNVTIKNYTFKLPPPIWFYLTYFIVAWLKMTDRMGLISLV